MTRLTVNEQNNNTEFHVHVGDELIVRLEAIPGTGYSWIVRGDIKQVLSQIGEPVFEKSGERVMGAVEHQVLSFRVDFKGLCELELDYRRPWQKPGTELNSISMTIIAEE